MDQSRLPLVKALEQYIGENALRQHMPGHKGGLGAPQPAQDLLGVKLWQADESSLRRVVRGVVRCSYHGFSTTGKNAYRNGCYGGLPPISEPGCLMAD